eukprot:6938944-Prymnesium_polylepis.1
MRAASASAFARAWRWRYCTAQMFAPRRRPGKIRSLLRRSSSANFDERALAAGTLSRDSSLRRSARHARPLAGLRLAGECASAPIRAVDRVQTRTEAHEKSCCVQFCRERDPQSGVETAWETEI